MEAILTHQSRRLARRSVVQGLMAAGGLTLIGCRPAERQATSEQPTPSNASADAVRQPVALTVYRDPGCGCCEEWVERARAAGYQATLADRTDMLDLKKRLGVPDQLASCHTTVAGAYVIEGHVPIDDVTRLLKERPAGIRGIAVPGMPRGSPGMEMPDGSKDEFQVMAFDASGRTSRFNS